MDKGKQGKRKKKQNSSGNEKRVENLETGLEDTNISPNQIENNSTSDISDCINILKSIKLKERKNLQNNPRNDAGATNHSKNNAEIAGRNENIITLKKPNQKKIKFKSQQFKKKKGKEVSPQRNKEPINHLDEGTFEFEDLLNKPEILELIQDLVDCFISNTTLPENEMQTLKISLCERFCSLFLNVLNNCVSKTLMRVLNTDFVQELKKKSVSKADACCQTIFSDTLEVKTLKI